MTDRSQGPAYLWRPDIQGTVDQMYEEYGEDHKWPGIPPYEIIEAYIQHESNGVPGAINPTPMDNGQHATGLMQIVPGLSVTGAWNKYTGEAVTQDQLLDPATNLQVGIVGLADRAIDVQRTGTFGLNEDGKLAKAGEASGPDWPTTTTIAMWGAGKTDGYGFWQPDWTVTDGPSGETGAGMRQYLADYVAGFGDDSKKALNRGDWRAGDDPNRKKWVAYNNEYTGPFPWIDGAYDGIKSTIGGAVESKIMGEISGAIDSAIPRMAMIGAGIALLAGALVILKTMMIKTAVGA